MADNSSITFLPSLNSGINAMPPAGTVDNHRAVSVELDVVDEQGAVAASPYRKTVVLKGPGEIVGFSTRMVARTEPAAGETGFEPNYFPFVEFTDPDFPWRYATGAGSPGKMLPWLALIVLKATEFTQAATAGAKVPAITVNEAFLPDPGQSWAWAHVQIAQGISGAAAIADYEETVRAINDNDPELTCSRLMCGRKLNGETSYSAFIVPLYQAGVDAALGNEAADNGGFAWAFGGTADRKLPVYYRWDFQTSEAGDFEELIDRLQCRAADAGFGGRATDASRPGFFCRNGQELEFYTRGARLERDSFVSEGPLVPPGYMEGPHARPPLAPVPFVKELSAVLNKELKPPVLSAKDGEDPLIALPVYGRYFQGTTALTPPAAGSASVGWVAELNLDRRLRCAAATGTAVVQEKQEEYARRCWDQVGEVREANALLRFGAAAGGAGKSLKQRHLDPLGDLRFALATQPCHNRYACTDGTGAEVSIKTALKGSGLPAGLVTATFRRTLGTKAGIGVINNESLFGDWLTRAATGTREADHDRSFIDDLANLWGPEESQQFGTWKGPEIPPLKPRIITVTVIPVVEILREQIDTGKDIFERLTELIHLPGGRKLISLDPIMAAPRIDDPMYRCLMGRSGGRLSPGLGGLKPNSAVLLEENRKFIESYLTGLNHEMGRELLWREYPTDQRGTIFSYFWDPVQSDNPPHDIAPIAEWSGEIGTHRPSGKFNNVVLIIKGDLIRRYPDTIIFAVATAKDESDWDWNSIYSALNGSGNNSEYTTYNPVFSARTGLDMLFLGFPFTTDDAKMMNYYFIMMQHPSLPRFGLNCSHVQPPDPYEGWDTLSWEDVPLDTKPAAAWVSAGPIANPPAAAADQQPPHSWGSDSAAMAWITFQDPVRLVIPAQIFLRTAAP